jgi:hypothetical protein
MRRPSRSAAAEVPARRSRQIRQIELIHPVHAGKANTFDGTIRKIVYGGGPAVGALGP